MYCAFDEKFHEKDQAISFAHSKLASAGELTRVSFFNVPDAVCKHCGAMLFDFQHIGNLHIGQQGDMMECFYDVANGLVCILCASAIAKLYIQEI
ncbi:MAG: hypothetical protein KAQ68_02275 [Clostridiales bacterium]|nr:hypothetical protein [Clostridiales bacterium]